MFEKQKLAAWSEHAMDFREGPADLFDAAQRERADHAIEGAFVKGHPFAAQNMSLNLDAALLDSAPGEAVHAEVRLDDADPADMLRVTGQVQAGAEADLENVALDV